MISKTEKRIPEEEIDKIEKFFWEKFAERVPCDEIEDADSIEECRKNPEGETTGYRFGNRLIFNIVEDRKAYMFMETEDSESVGFSEGYDIFEATSVGDVMRECLNYGLQDYVDFFFLIKGKEEKHIDGFSVWRLGEFLEGMNFGSVFGMPTERSWEDEGGARLFAGTVVSRIKAAIEDAYLKYPSVKAKTHIEQALNPVLEALDHWNGKEQAGSE